MSEYVKHIRHTHMEKSQHAWCGEPISQFDWTFVDIDHAAYNALAGARLVACPDCVNAVITALKSE